MNYRNYFSVTGIIFLILIFASCAAIKREKAMDTEQLLAAAGFAQIPADTPERLEHLSTLPQRQIVTDERDNKIYYFYADKKTCKCLFVGDQSAYQKFQELTVREKIADERLEAAEDYEDASMNWDLWGPFWW